jgi:hypothetical protein
MYIRKDKKLMGMEGSDRYFETFVSCGRVNLASLRSQWWNCRSRNFLVHDVYHGTRSNRV